jgi:hypothetical protein
MYLMVLVAFGCIDSVRPRAEVEADGGAAAFDATVIDATVVDDAQPVDAERPLDAIPSGCCALTVETTPTDGFELHEPVLDEGEVYVHRRGPDGQLRVVRAHDGAPVGGPADLLVDLHGETALLLRPDGDGGRRLIVRHGGQEQLVEEVTLRQWPAPFAHNGVRVVDEGLAAWIGPEGVAWWTPGSGRVAPGVVAQMVTAAAGRVAWVADGTLWLVDTAEAEAPRPVAEVGLGAWAALTDEMLAWVDNGALQMLPLDSPDAVPTVAPWNVVCEDFAVHGRTLIARCPMNAQPSLVMRYRLGDERADLLDQAPYIAGVAAGPGGVAWAAYDEFDAWCSGLSPGEIRWLRDDCDTPTVVAPVQAGCMCCGALWPMLYLSLDGDQLAYNYAAGREGAAVGLTTCR